MEITTLALFILVPLLVWRVYGRLKRMMSRTESHLWQHWTLAGAFALFIVLGALSVRADALALATLAGGVLAGVWAGVLGLKLTRFQRTEQGFFYTPHRQLGVLVSILFIARVMYRGLELYVNSRQTVPVPLPNSDFLQSPLTTLSFGLACAYYAWYGLGLARWRRRQTPLKTVTDPLDFDLPK
jgi:cytochrome b561